MKSWQLALAIVVIVAVFAYVSTQKPKAVKAPTAGASSNNVFSAITSIGGAIAGKVTAPSATPGTPYAPALTPDQKAAAYGQGYGLAQGMSDQQLSDSIQQGQQEEDSFTNPFAGTLLG